jgi:uncharacterized protein (DUF1697 family)
MSRHVAFLRAINVGGHTVTMARLRELFEGFGLRRVETFIASGNVIFETRSADIDKIRRAIEAGLHRSLGYEVSTFIRSEAEVAAIARYRPFAAARIEASGAFCVGFLDTPLGADGRQALTALETDIDTFHLAGREVYWLCKTGQGQSTFSNMVFEKKVKARVTFRGVPTIVRLAAKLAAFAGHN